MSSQTPILIQLVSSRLWGDIESYTLDISRYFRNLGWDVDIFTRDIRAIDSVFAHAGLKVRHAPLSGYFDFSTVIPLQRFLRKYRNQPIVIHTHHYRDAFTALLARKLARLQPSQVKVVCTAHKCRPAREGRLMRRIYRNLDSLIFVSDLAKRRFLSKWKEGAQPFPLSSISTLTPSLDISDYPDYTPPSEKGPFNLLYMGRLSPEKGIENLIGAMRFLKGKRIRLVIAGTGYADYIDSLQQLAVIKEVNTLIDWKGPNFSRQDIIRECHAGICVSPIEEPFSLFSLELMAMGRTQIIPPTGSFDEFLTPYDKYPIEKADSIQLKNLDEETIAGACEYLGGNRELCSQMGKRARENFLSRPSAVETMECLRKIYTGNSYPEKNVL